MPAFYSLILMKTFSSLLAITFSIFGFHDSICQDLALVKEQLNTVETAKVSFRQEIKEMEDGMVQFILTGTDTKGKEEESIYNFSFSDIDANTVRALTKKDVIVIQLLVAGKQKLIQLVTNSGDKISYLDKLTFMARDSENAKLLEERIKGVIPLYLSADEKRFSLNGYDAHINWLKANVSDIELPKKQIVQQLTTNEVAGKLIINQTINAKKSSKNQLRELNLAILNPNSVNYRISGDEFTIKAETRRRINGIRFEEDAHQKNFGNQITLYAKSVANGKEIYRVLKNLIPLAEHRFNASTPNITTETVALKTLNGFIKEVSATEEILTQNLTIDNNLGQLTQTETSPDKSIELISRFNFGDINENNIDYNGQKDRLYAIIPTKKSVSFIQKVENGVLQNYDKDVKIYFNTIEDAIIGTDALKFLAATYNEKLEKTSFPVQSASKAVTELKNIMQKVKIGEDSYDLFIELTDPKTKTVKISTVFSNLKKSVETVQEFSLKDINPKNCTINIKGKHVIAELNTKHLEKIVKTYVDGGIKPYQYKIGIEAKGIEEARKIVDIFKNISETIK